jgi:hypothetical protein
MNKLLFERIIPDKSAKCIPLSLLTLRNVRQLGTGISSVVVKYGDIALKILPFDKWAMEETTLMLKIAFLSQYCVIFGEFHGWFVCSKIPDGWIDEYGFATDLQCWIKKRKHLIVLGLEYTRFSVFDFTYTGRDLKYILFILLHGIGVARRLVPNFRHRDIHSGNILIQKHDELELLPLTLSCGTIFKLKDVKYIPKLIDFGEAKMDNPDEDHELYEPFRDVDGRLFEPRSDVFRISLVIMQMITGDQREFEEFFASPEYTRACAQDDYLSIEKLLKSPFFRQSKISDYFKKLKI